MASVLLVVLLLLCWLFVTRSRVRRLRHEREQADAIERDPGLGHVQDQERELNRQLANFLGHVGGRRAMNRLPRYLMIGAERAGKSSLLERSGQRFSLTQIGKAQALGRQEQQPAQAVKWWVSDHAIILDPPGDFITQGIIPTRQPLAANTSEPSVPPGNPARLWVHLLGWLTRNRPGKALNGVILVVDLAALLHATPAQRVALAHALRARLFELSNELGLRLPLYIVLSKIDLLDGFGQLFSRLGMEQRDALFGFTAKLDRSGSSDAWLSDFSDHYARMIQLVQAHVRDGLGALTDASQRKRLLSFQAQFAGLRPALMAFLHEALASDRFTTAPLVRGLYLSSVMQQGEIENAFLRESAQRYRVPRPLREALKPGLKASPYFAQQIFQQILYPEAGLAGDNLRVTRRKRRSLWVGSSISLLAIAAAAATLHRFSDIAGCWKRCETTRSFSRSQCLWKVMAVPPRWPSHCPSRYP
ncbi:type VI secretion protein IcmF/TssM N-terminal domain-containing protein [Pantoea sp. Ap-967]|uniref:type VI secretion protein IcmF/TssM N-terminal domain-containing protein n=1 Tax=Pantoea sp. Ap-967 TaxID=2608362 RepID=UPI0019634FF6|nr:type VI secretion protein IcmF/TssM N-terminal domain-containing protein [Pantoea sp. Ap-967]